MNQLLLPEPKPTVYELPGLTISEVIATLQDIKESFGDVQVYTSDITQKVHDEVGAVVSFNLREDGGIRHAAVLIPNGTYFTVTKVSKP